MRRSALTLLAWLAISVLIWAGTNLFRPSPDAPRHAWDALNTGTLPVLRSHGGVLTATLVAAPLHVAQNGLRVPAAGYNFSYGGPVLRARPGDLVRLTLVNRMDGAVNLHFHGLRIPPGGHGDNMAISVPPGAFFTYEFRIPPGHPPGLFWYHDHAGESAEAHVMAGLSGALVIDGFARQFAGGAISRLPEELLVLKDLHLVPCPQGTPEFAFRCRFVSINGETSWQSRLGPGGEALWRISNQGANLILHLRAPGLRFRIIGRDGLPLAVPENADMLDILPAGRLDVLARAPAAGTYILSARFVPTGLGRAFSIDRPLGRITAEAPCAAPVPVQPPVQRDLRGLQVQARRDVVFSESGDSTRFFINGRAFDHTRVDMRAEAGSIEAWHVRNDTRDFHEFHIHQLGFQVTAINGEPQAFDGFIDTVRVPEMGSVDLLLPLTDPAIAGHIMVHCHVLLHEDHGMMAILHVAPPGLLHICRAPG